MTFFPVMWRTSTCNSFNVMTLMHLSGIVQRFRQFDLTEFSVDINQSDFAELYFQHISGLVLYIAADWTLCVRNNMRDVIPNLFQLVI